MARWATRAAVFRTLIITAIVIAGCRRRPPAPPPHVPTPPTDTTAGGPDSLGTDAAEDSSTVMVVGDTGAPTRQPAHQAAPVPPPPPIPARTALSPLADSIAQYLVFDPIGESWFLAAARGKKPLIDLGRVDLDVKKEPRRRTAYLEAVRALAPVAIGTRFRLRGAWGSAEATVKGYDVWNGRIVATITAPPIVDSLARAATTFIASAQRIDSTATPVDTSKAHPDTSKAHPDTSKARSDTVKSRGDSVVGVGDSATVDTCDRHTLSPDLATRAAVVRDSIESWLAQLPPPPLPRLVATEKAVATQAIGCFGKGRRVALVVDLRAGNNEWIRERMVLIDTLGVVSTVRVDDYRFKGHDVLYAMDGYGDGVDGVAARGVAEASGGTVILRLTPASRFQRVADGFAWESR
jgi:hypothetical protein